MARLLPVLAVALLALPARAQTPTVLGEGIISTDQIEYGPAFSPDGNTLYFTRRASFSDAPQILVSRRTDQSWTEPEAVSFGHPAGDELPSLSPDGMRLYFSSARPAPGREDNGRNDMWMVSWQDGGWSEAEHLGGSLSTDDIDSHPVETDDGLYFHSRRGGAVDAYFAAGEVGAWSDPEVLPFNSDATDGEVALLPDGTGAVFYSERPGGAGRGDLYFVARTDSGWGDPVNLGDTINTDAWEWSPGFTALGKSLVFGRLNGAGDDSDLLVVEFQAPGR
ncbi:MAG: PD40 domain-containing protein [Rhodothermales bacterium]|nr:PD40 domain-containing protein [Rhodothermales bacterium]MBO6779022.1 PD40 domain-containing protein [Rhodothermales bacterium]